MFNETYVKKSLVFVFNDENQRGRYNYCGIYVCTVTIMLSSSKYIQMY